MYAVPAMILKMLAAIYNRQQVVPKAFRHFPFQSQVY